MHMSNEACNVQDNIMFFFAALADINEGTKYRYSDLTGRFPVQLYLGMQYIFVAYIFSLEKCYFYPSNAKQDI